MFRGWDSSDTVGGPPAGRAPEGGLPPGARGFAWRDEARRRRPRGTTLLGQVIRPGAALGPLSYACQPVRPSAARGCGPAWFFRRFRGDLVRWACPRAHTVPGSLLAAFSDRLSPSSPCRQLTIADGGAAADRVSPRPIPAVRPGLMRLGRVPSACTGFAPPFWAGPGGRRAGFRPAGAGDIPGAAWPPRPGRGGQRWAGPHLAGAARAPPRGRISPGPDVFAVAGRPIYSPVTARDPRSIGGSPLVDISRIRGPRYSSRTFGCRRSRCPAW